MSAFIVENSTMQRAVNAIALAEGIHDHVACDRLGTALFALNVRAVTGRYGDRVGAADLPAPYKHVSIAVPPPTNVHSGAERAKLCVLLKGLECLLYQCAEGDCPECDLYIRADTAAARLRSAIINGLAEYVAAPW
jgi:hypothetical protein